MTDMLKVMDRHRDLDLFDIRETSETSLRLIIAEMGVIEDAPPITSKEEPNAVLRSLMNSSKLIAVSDSNAHYEVVFDDYITYSIINESYANKTEGTYEGRSVRVYTKSVFLDYISQVTFATFDYPGEFKHYEICCCNHIIDIASTQPPQIKILDAR